MIKRVMPYIAIAALVTVVLIWAQRIATKTAETERGSLGECIHDLDVMSRNLESCISHVSRCNIEAPHER